MKDRTFIKLVFDGGFDDRDQAEALMRGYRSHVWVELDDGTRHQVTFYDVTRLSQTIDEECASGRKFFTEHGLIVVPEVTFANMEAAAQTLVAEGFFTRPER